MEDPLEREREREVIIHCFQDIYTSLMFLAFIESRTTKVKSLAAIQLPKSPLSSNAELKAPSTEWADLALRGAFPANLAPLNATPHLLWWAAPLHLQPRDPVSSSPVASLFCSRRHFPSTTRLQEVHCYCTSVLRDSYLCCLRRHLRVVLGMNSNND